MKNDVYLYNNMGWNFSDLNLLKFQIYNLIDFKEGIVFVDLDETLRCTKNRMHLLPTNEQVKSFGDKPNDAYIEYHDACANGNDKPITGMIDHIKYMHRNGWIIIPLTSCMYSERSLSGTVHFMQKYDIPYFCMILRGRNNHLHPVDMKREILKELGVEGFGERIKVYDDNPDIIKAVNQLGISGHLCVN